MPPSILALKFLPLLTITDPCIHDYPEKGISSSDAERYARGKMLHWPCSGPESPMSGKALDQPGALL
ncbi:hypothetical protein [Desulfosarcina alkanivorans]|jgi:hypothetical protein|uniref:hypothetical protein n=1 Tax=Desulfosarcina alkanivorans TaxID=571177 RepID=UPI00142EB259|nr:hypothetical protein [Desulfosarcina alkanivorans]